MALDNATDMMLSFSSLKEAALAGGTVVHCAKRFLQEEGKLQGRVEIEGRLGKAGPGGFSSDIGSASFCTILQLLETYPRWSHVSKWEESQDVFYTLSLPPGTTNSGSAGGSGGGQVQVRTSVTSKDGHHAIEHIVKRKIKQADFSLQSMDQGSCALGTDTGKLTDDVAARITASLETLLPADVLPVAVTPDVVRIKQRKRFLLPSVGIEGDTFAFDLTVVYSGASKSEAERNQRLNENASFEVEVECLSPSEYLSTCGDEASCLALSILVKLLDFAQHLNPTIVVTFVPRESDVGRGNPGSGCGVAPLPSKTSASRAVSMGTIVGSPFAGV